MATAEFPVTPEKEASVLNFFYRQLTFTPSEVKGVSLAGKTAIVTGSNTGVGLECSRQLLDLGISKLILAVRNEAKGQAAVANLSARRELAEDAIEVWRMDLSSYKSITSFVERTKSLDRIDIVILNAGIAPLKQERNAETGHDEVIQVNYLSTALLTILLPVLKSKRPNQDQPSRITFTSSDAAAWTSFNERAESPLLASFDKPDKADMTDRYFVSKLLAQFFLTEIAKHVPTSVAVMNAATPGMCHDSELNRELDQTIKGKVAKIAMRRVGYSTAVGARMVTDAAVNHGDETHGHYLGLQRIKPMAPVIYTPEGKQISDLLWKETMAELDFAGVEQTLKVVGNVSS
ncbi:hypothetical protein MW887_000851 [Aspergillus wentii]|nr:hypothetical protein MW887_000851 [Aspergillus wentii]